MLFTSRQHYVLLQRGFLESLPFANYKPGKNDTAQCQYERKNSCILFICFFLKFIIFSGSGHSDFDPIYKHFLKTCYWIIYLVICNVRMHIYPHTDIHIYICTWNKRHWIVLWKSSLSYRLYHHKKCCKLYWNRYTESFQSSFFWSSLI